MLMFMWDHFFWHTRTCFLFVRHVTPSLMIFCSSDDVNICPTSLQTLWMTGDGNTIFCFGFYLSGYTLQGSCAGVFFCNNNRYIYPW
mmetsp:Transcript_37212/g.57930  ORF Transcript_37212/g.57930 Transcript_37212/m.57930 type:complete len:87 (+) Transcript_37212:685-945(+)